MDSKKRAFGGESRRFTEWGLKKLWQRASHPLPLPPTDWKIPLQRRRVGQFFFSLRGRRPKGRVRGKTSAWSARRSHAGAPALISSLPFYGLPRRLIFFSENTKQQTVQGRNGAAPSLTCDQASLIFSSHPREIRHWIMKPSEGFRGSLTEDLAWRWDENALSRNHSVNSCCQCLSGDSIGVYTFCTETLETHRQGKLPRLLAFVNGAMRFYRTRRLCNCRPIRWRQVSLLSAWGRDVSLQ